MNDLVLMSIVLNVIMPSVDIYLLNRDEEANFIILEMVGYDVILVMGWMSEHHVKVYYLEQRVRFSPPGQPKL